MYFSQNLLGILHSPVLSTLKTRTALGIGVGHYSSPKLALRTGKELGQDLGVLNPSYSKATFVQSTRMQILMKTI